MLGRTPMKHNISLENETIEYVCYYDNDLILKTSFFCLYLNRFTLKSYIVDAIENISFVRQYKDIIYYFCYNEIENFKIERIHMNNSVFHLGESDYIYFDPKHNVLFTHNYKFYTIYKVNGENIQLCTSFDPYVYIYKKYIHLKDTEIFLHGVRAYYNNIKQSLHLFILVNINHNIFCFFITIIQQSTVINLCYITSKQSLLSFELYSDKILYLNCLNEQFLYDFCVNNFKPLCSTGLIYKTEYINNLHSMYIEYAGYFSFVTLKDSKTFIIGHYDSLSPLISEDEMYIFYIYNKSIFVRKLVGDELYISKHVLQDDFIPSCMTYKKAQGLLVGCTQGYVLEFGLIF